MRQQLIWIGTRQSDIADTNQIFDGSITIFGSGEDGNYSMEHDLHRRIDHNGECAGYEDFVQRTMGNVLADFPYSRFVQYAPLDGAKLPAELQDRFCYQNDYTLIEFLEHKLALKQWAAKYVPVLPYHIISGRECNFSNLRELFPDQEYVVIQRDSSCGGEGTFLISLNEKKMPVLPVEADELCIVTAFQINSISVNIHAVLYPEQTVLFPPSIQIIDQEHVKLEYLGADFSAYSTVCTKERELALKTTAAICDRLRRLGYRGVCGVDLLLTDEACYFMEVNPRFQASTALLNSYLLSLGIPSVQEYHMDSFEQNTSRLPDPPEFAKGSFFIYHFRQDRENQLYWLWNKLQNMDSVSLCDDHLCWQNVLDDNCYIFQLRCKDAISSLTYQHTLRVHPNIRLSSFALEDRWEFSNLLRLKLLLLSRGVFITPRSWDTMQDIGGVDWEEFSAVTIRVFQKLWITAPCMEDWHELSPLQLDILPDGDKPVLCYYGKVLFPIEIMPKDSCGELQTAKGHRLKDIVYLNPDRLRIYHRNGCALQDLGIGCKFCDLFGEEEDFDFDDICEALSYYWQNPRVKHFLIGGGSELYTEQCGSILRLAEYLHAHSDKNIYLMSQPICDLEVLRRLQRLGVTEVSFNIEVFNRSLAREIMPGKARNTLEYYLDSLENAVSVWGNSGNVRSALLLGFDNLKDFSQGIRRLCQIGVSPILSLYRPCSGTLLSGYMPVDEQTALLYYETANQICKEYGIKLGPACKACQNNVVVLDM